MAEKLILIKKVYNKPQYQRVINTQFSQLAISTSSTSSSNINTDIATAASNINASIDASTQANEDIQALIDEINNLQQQNLELNQQLIELQVSSSQT